MPVIRANRNENYTVMSNVHLKDKRMTLKAKGLLSVVLSLPPDWDYSFAGLVAICKESETAMKSAIKELKEFGYLTITKERDEKGHFDYVYVFNENPQTDLPVVENPVVENPPTDNPMVENVRQLNTNKLNTKELNTNKSNTKRVKENTLTLFEQLKDDYALGDNLKEKIREWLQYKQERKEQYKETGLKSLLKQIQNKACTYGETAVCNLIDDCMANNWKGIIWDRLNQQNTYNKSKVDDKTAEEKKKADEEAEFRKLQMQKAKELAAKGMSRWQ